MRAKKLASLLEFSLQNNLPVLVKGKPGIGKSDIVTQACNKLGYELIISHPVVADPTDYKGLPFVVKDGAEFLPFGDLKKLLNAEKPIVYFLDDLGQATPAVQSAVMQLLLARQINGHKISPEVRFVAATNRREDRANVSGILEPVKSRFASIVELEVNTEDWVSWALQNNMPTEVISFIQFRPRMLDDFKATRDIENSPSPRTVAYVGKMLNAGVPSDIRFETIKGAAGESFAIEFEAFLKVFMTLPSFTQIVLDPNNSPVPDEISGRFAVTGLISEKMGKDNVGSCITYLKRVGEEFTVAAMKNSTIKNPSICSTREFITWGSENGELFMS
jgi:hypothetical protein